MPTATFIAAVGDGNAAERYGLVLANLKRGAVVGLFFAAFYSLYVLVLYALEGPRPFAEHHTTLQRLLAAYLFGGIAAGAIVGMLQPLIRGRFSAAVVGVLAAFFVSVGITVASDGLFREWTTANWVAIGFMSLFFGIAGGIHFWGGSPAQ